MPPSLAVGRPLLSALLVYSFLILYTLFYLRILRLLVL